MCYIFSRVHFSCILGRNLNGEFASHRGHWQSDKRSNATCDFPSELAEGRKQGKVVFIRAGNAEEQSALRSSSLICGSEQRREEHNQSALNSRIIYNFA